MAMLQVAPIISTRGGRESLLAPNGTYYTTRFPSPGIVQELIEAGVKRVICSGWTDEYDLWVAVRELVEAGIDFEMRHP